MRLEYRTTKQLDIKTIQFSNQKNQTRIGLNIIEIPQTKICKTMTVYTHNYNKCSMWLVIYPINKIALINYYEVLKQKHHKAGFWSARTNYMNFIL